MDSAWVGVIGTLLGTILGGLIVWSREIDQRSHDLDKENRVRLSEKYENIHKELSLVEKQSSMIALQIMGEVGYGRKFDAKSLSEGIPLESLKMHVEFYAPELQEGLENISKLMQKQFEVVGKFILKIEKREAKSEDLAAQALLLSKEITKNVANLKEQLSVNAHKLVKIA